MKIKGKKGYKLTRTNRMEEESIANLETRNLIAEWKLTRKTKISQVSNEKS